ncbi:type 2 isopentenyl-diphosphate Delta-isomerase [Dellaglioa sp. P0083]|uniref:type 2 isopentenyl-diphosphate Delta-isomerase n=1 Tax=Dellaglioa kimchii TaxID=3344667 RepID=UPI0038D3EAC1
MIKDDNLIQSHRKDEHVFIAEKLFNTESKNQLNEIKLIPSNLPELSINDIQSSVELPNFSFQSPFYINAMTGGSEQTGILNQQLAEVAAITNTPIATGSQSIALKDPSMAHTFKILREKNPNGLIFSNLSANATLEQAKRAVDMIEANALQIHINAAQEIVMPEGEREFYWLKNIETLVNRLEVPIIVKEVGFGMSHKTVQQLADIGVRYVDISGRGGTNFAMIENERRHAKDFSFLEDWGLTTAESLIDTKSLQTGLTIFASGGIRTPLDIVKCLALGAKSVGISGAFLHILNKQGQDALTNTILDYQSKINMLMLLLGTKNLSDLTKIRMILSPELQNFKNQI